MQKYAEKRGLHLHGKLILLTELGLLRSSSARRLNLIRNKIEHEYARPDIHDLDAFYDLVALVIDKLERAAVAPDEVDLVVAEGLLKVQYDDLAPRITFELWKFVPDEGGPLPRKKEVETYEVALYADRDDFARCFRIVFLLGDQVVNAIDMDTLLDRLGEIDAEVNPTFESSSA